MRVRTDEHTRRHQKARWLVAVLGMAVVGLVTPSCSGGEGAEAWELESPPPTSTVNSNLCQDFSARAPDEARVGQADESSEWRIEYPVFKSGCGVYQLDALLQAEGDSVGGSTYRHEISVCNRCESPQTWNYLKSEAVGAGEGEDKPIPKTLDREKVSELLFPDGGPVIGHAVEATATSVQEVSCAESGTIQPTDGKTYWQLENVTYFRIAPGSTRSYTIRRNYRQFRSAWLETTSRNDTAETTIRWPRLFHRNFDLTGAHAASAQQYCVEEGDQNTGLEYNRPFAEPYRPELKYATQRVTRPELPPSLMDTLESQNP